MLTNDPTAQLLLGLAILDWLQKLQTRPQRRSSEEALPAQEKETSSFRPFLRPAHQR